jgi:hypothetical protein
MERWSAADGWVDQARSYDTTLATLAAQEAADAYCRDLERHRETARREGGALLTLARSLITKAAQKLQSFDGRELTPAELVAVIRVAVDATRTGLDLEAHALHLDKLLPQLEPTGGEH